MTNKCNITHGQVVSLLAEAELNRSLSRERGIELKLESSPLAPRRASCRFLPTVLKQAIDYRTSTRTVHTNPVGAGEIYFGRPKSPSLQREIENILT